MSKWIATVAAVLGVALAAAPSQACHKGGCATCAPACAPCVTYQVNYVEKTVTCMKPEWREKDITCTVNRCIPREVVEERKVCVLVPETRQEKRTITVCRQVPREIEVDVTCCQMVPVACTDPCTGCTVTVCKPQYVTKKVKKIVCDLVPEQREIVVNVCNYRQEERTIQCKRIVFDIQPETVVRKVRECVMVPYTTTVKVPVCVPVACAPACN